MCKLETRAMSNQVNLAFENLAVEHINILLIGLHLLEGEAKVIGLSVDGFEHTTITMKNSNKIEARTVCIRPSDHAESNCWQ